MKKLFAIFGLILGSSAFADSNITVNIDSLTNISGNGAMEACGRATHASGMKPLLVTVKHDHSYYTTMTAPNGVWCVVVKRWTFNGAIEVGAATLSSPDDLEMLPAQSLMSAKK